MGSPFIDYDHPFPTFGRAGHDPFLSQDASFVITNGQLTINKPLFVFPVATLPNATTPLPPMNETETKLVAFAHYLRMLADQLSDQMNSSRKASEELSGAVATMQTLAALATLLDRRSAMAKVSPVVAAKAKKLANAAEKLAEKAATKLGKDAPNAANVVPAIRDKVHGCYGEIENALRNPELIGLWDTYTQDKTVPEERKKQFLFEFKEVMAYVVEILMRSPDHKAAADLALEGFNKPKSNVFGKVLSVTASIGSVAGNTVGNLPGPDALALALAKCYATYHLPTAAVSKAEARSLEDVLHQMFIQSMNYTKQDARLFRDYFIRVADAQDKVATAERRLLSLRGAAQASAEKIKAAEGALQKAQATAQTESNRLRDFLVDANKGGEPKYTRFDRFQSGTAISTALTVVALIQLVNAFQNWDDPEKPTALKVTDVLSSGIASGLGLIYTVNKFPIPAGLVKTRLAYLNGLAGAKVVSKAIVVLGLVAGALQFGYAMWGDDEVNVKEAVLGGASFISSALLLLGLTLINPALTAIGLVIAVGLGLYALYDCIVEAFTCPTENLYRGVLKVLKSKKLSWNKTEMYKVLGCEAEFDALNAAVDAMDWFLVPVDYDSAKDEAEVRSALGFLGFEDKTINGILAKRPLPPIPLQYGLPYGLPPI